MLESPSREIIYYVFGNQVGEDNSTIPEAQ